MRQTEFVGLTGAVKFDNRGMRTGFSLDILEVSLSRGLAKVGLMCLFDVISLLTSRTSFAIRAHFYEQKN